MTLFTLLTLFGLTSTLPPYTCGQKEARKQPYGTVQLRVECKYLKIGGMISVQEYQGKTQHGIDVDYDSAWHKRDSTFFVNGREEGAQIFWDSLGNIVGRKSFRNGVQIGKEENYWTPGQPSIFKSYNSKGQEDGPWQEWWKNGNKKGEFIAKNGHIISAIEYYQNGSVRVKYRTKYDPRNNNLLKIKHIDGEAWAPNGRPTGAIVKGNGEWIVFPNGQDSSNTSVFHEVYKDSIMVKVEALDSSKVAAWLK